MILILKRSSIIITALCIFVFALAVIFGIHSSLSANTIPHHEIKTIIIDPGHGEPDGGSVAKDGTQEEGLNLLIAQKLDALLAQDGHNIIMTRTTNSGIQDENAKTITQKKKTDMYARRDIQSNSSADIFVSIHINKFEQSKYYGAQVVYAGDERSQCLATSIQNALREYVDHENNRIEMKAPSTIFLLKSAPIPSVIVECGFLSNQNELDLLKTDDYQNKIAFAVKTGIDNYFNQYQ